MIGTLLAIQTEHDPALSQHAERVASLATRLGHKLALPIGALHHIQRAALLHDIGKLMVPRRILHKAEPLSAAEWQAIQGHSLYARLFLEAGADTLPLFPTIRAIHEAWDGSGYPDGLRSRDIPLFSRLIAVVDAFDALTMARAYREALSLDEALRQLNADAGRRYDPQLTQLFTQVVHSPSVESLWRLPRMAQPTLATSA